MAEFTETALRLGLDARGMRSGAQQAEQALQQVEGAARRAATGVDTIEGSFRRLLAMTNSVSRFVATAALAVSGYAAGLGLLATRGTEVVAVHSSFQRVAGDTSAALEQLRRSTHGLVSEFDLMVGYNRALTLGSAKNVEEFARLAETAITLGRALGVDASFALESLNIGIARQSRLILDNLGIIVSAEDANKRYAESIGKTAEQLTEAEQREAFRAAALEAAERAVRALGGIQQTAGDSVTRFVTQVKNLRNELARAIAQSPAVRDAVESVLDVLESMGDQMPTVVRHMESLARTSADVIGVAGRLAEAIIRNSDTIINLTKDVATATTVVLGFAAAMRAAAAAQVLFSGSTAVGAFLALVPAVKSGADALALLSLGAQTAWRAILGPVGLVLAIGSLAAALFALRRDSREAAREVAQSMATIRAEMQGLDVIQAGDQMRRTESMLGIQRQKLEQLRAEEQSAALEGGAAHEAALRAVQMQEKLVSGLEQRLQALRKRYAELGGQQAEAAALAQRAAEEERRREEERRAAEERARLAEEQRTQALRDRLDLMDTLIRIDEKSLEDRLSLIETELQTAQRGTERWKLLVNERQVTLEQLRQQAERTKQSIEDMFRTQMSFERTRAELTGDTVRVAEIEAHEQALRHMEIAERLVEKGRLTAQQFEEFMELLVRSVSDAIEAAQRRIEDARTSFEADLRAREALLAGDPVGAARIRAEEAARGQLRAAEELRRAGTITEEQLRRLAAVLEKEVAQEVEKVERASSGAGQRLQMVESALQGIFAGLGAHIGGPVGGAVAGLGAGLVRDASGALTLDPTSALIGAAVGFFTSAIADLFSAGRDAEEAARQAEAARLAWLEALDALNEIASPSGPLASRAKAARDAAEQAAEALGFKPGIGFSAFEALQRERAKLEEQLAEIPPFTVDLSGGLTVLRSRFEELDKVTQAYARALEALAQTVRDDLELRALSAQGLDREAELRRQELEHAEERRQIDALIAEGADEALRAQLEYVQALEAAALAAELAAQAERDRADFLAELATLRGDTVGAARIEAEARAQDRIRAAEQLLNQGIITAEEFAEFVALVAESVNKAVAELERTHQLQADAFAADVAAREAELAGDSETARQIRLRAQQQNELESARRLLEAGIITQEMFDRFAALLEGEFAKAMEEAAEATEKAARAQEQAARAALQDLEVRRLVALGQDDAAQKLRLELDHERERTRAIEEGASEEFLRKLEEVQRLEMEALERQLAGGGGLGAAADAAAATVAREIQAITQDQAITMLYVLRTMSGHLAEIAENTRPLRGMNTSALSGSVAAAPLPRSFGNVYHIHVHGITDARQLAERFLVILRTDPRFRRQFDAVQANMVAEATETAGVMGRGG